MGRVNLNDPLLAKVVKPRPPRQHAFFGKTFLSHHMMADEQWTPSSISDEFSNMTQLLTKRVIVQKLALEAMRNSRQIERTDLKRQCRDGRTKLHAILSSKRLVRNQLVNHKDMQRHYEHMPPEMVANHINQCSFTMRKEYDRTKYRVNQLQKIYKEKLLQRSELENRVKYENEFVLEEEAKIREVTTCIENSRLRLRAVSTIHMTYKKMIQILRQDSIFYEPILKSLTDDIEDQTKFINQIFFIGMPGLAAFKRLSEQYRSKLAESRKKIALILHFEESFRKNFKNVNSHIPISGKHDSTHSNHYIDGMERYVRNTESMQLLSMQADTIAEVIKSVKYATLSSKFQEIFPNIKNQTDINIKLQKDIQKNLAVKQDLETTVKYAGVMEDMVVQQLEEKERKFHNIIEHLKSAIEEEDEREAETLARMNQLADIFVLFKFSLWKLNDIMTYVTSPITVKASTKTGTSSYLKLPLLKFEMFTMRAVPPGIYEGNIDKIFHTVKQKLTRLLRYCDEKGVTGDSEKLSDDYHKAFLDESGRRSSKSSYFEDLATAKVRLESELFLATRSSLPTRKTIKIDSQKILEKNIVNKVT